MIRAKTLKTMKIRVSSRVRLLAWDSEELGLVRTGQRAKRETNKGMRELRRR